MKIAAMLLLACLTAKAAAVPWTGYISQSGSGDGATNSLAWFASGTNGMTNVVMTGTFTNLIGINQNGTPAAPLHLTFDTQPSFLWPTVAEGSSIISGTATHDVIIDGAWLQTTSNRSDAVYSPPFFTNTFNGISLTCNSNIEILNCTLLDFCPRASNQWNLTTAPQGIRIGGAMSNLKIHNNNITNIGNGILVFLTTGSSTNIDIYSNNVWTCSFGIAVIASASDSYYYSSIHDNRIQNGHEWDSESPSPLHNDGIFVSTSISALNSTNLMTKIYRNVIGPTNGWGTTSAIYIDSTQSGVQNKNVIIFNNVLLGEQSSRWNSGYIGANGSNTRILNNTIGVRGLIANGTGLAVAGGAGGISPFVLNNLMCDISTAFNPATSDGQSMTPTNGMSSLNYNYFSFGWGQDNGHGWVAVGNNSQLDYATFHAHYGLTADTNNIIIYSDPIYGGQYPARALLETNALFKPLTNDVTVVGHGTNLTAMAIALNLPELRYDINGVLRPSVGQWTIGASQVAVAVIATNASSFLRLQVTNLILR